MALRLHVMQKIPAAFDAHLMLRAIAPLPEFHLATRASPAPPAFGNVSMWPVGHERSSPVAADRLAQATIDPVCDNGALHVKFLARTKILYR